MAGNVKAEMVVEEQRAGAEIITGLEQCLRSSTDLLSEIGFPLGILPLKDLVECGRVRSTGFVWMKQRAPSQHYFEATKSLVSYEVEVTCYVEKHKMRKMTGVKTKQVLFWVPLVEMTIDDPSARKIYFKTSLGVGRYFPLMAFMTEEDKRYYNLESKGQQSTQKNNSDDGTAATLGEA